MQTNAFSVPYYGSPHGRNVTATPESRKKGSTSVKEVVVGALAAGAGLALLGAISNNRRPRYGHYPNYPSHCPTPASAAYSSYAHSPYHLPSQPLYPTYAQPGYSTYAKPAYPNQGGYGPGYPFGRSEEFILHKSSKDLFENQEISLADETSSDIPSIGTVNENNFEDQRVLNKDNISSFTELEDEVQPASKQYFLQILYGTFF